MCEPVDDRCIVKMPSNANRRFDSDYRGDRDAHLFCDAQYIVAATRAVLVDFMGRFLLVRRRNDGRWALPYGVILPGESARDSMERVVNAQAGVKVMESAPFISDSGKHMSMPGRLEAQLNVFGYRLTKWRGYVDASNAEIVETGWFSYGQAEDVLSLWGDDWIAIEDLVGSDYDPPVPAEGRVVWVR